MIKLTNRTATVAAALSLALLALPIWSSLAQERKLAYDDWYGDVKKTLTDHYTGKTVKLRMAIPATRRGLELTDGELPGAGEKDLTPALAQPGDELTIKSFKVRDTSIELLLNREGEQPKTHFFSWPKRPRINLRFSRELTVKDMTIESINHWLAAAIDVGPLAPVMADQSTPSTTNTQASIASEPESAAKPAVADPLQSLPTASVTGNLPPGSRNFGELTVECSTGSARVYIDDAYSGSAPRTVRLNSGVHSILVMANGFAAWEQRLVIPGGKSSVVKAELQR